MDSDSNTEFSLESFRIVRSASKPRPDQEGTDAVPVPTMAALSPDPPCSPMSEDDDAQSQPLPGTDQEGADAMDAPMAMVRWLPDPRPPRFESGFSRSPLRPPYKTAESIVNYYSKRRGALTEDEEAFLQKCNPGMQPLHLYSSTGGNWEVKPPDFNLPPPEPSEPTPTERGQLLAVLTGLSTVHEILLASSDTYHVEEKRSSGPAATASVEEEKVEEHYAQEKRSSGPEVVEEEQYTDLIEEQRASGPSKANEMLEEEEDVTNDDDNFCASCNSRYNKNGFWICCSSCEKWYHGKCVNITSSKAEHMEHFECHDCYSERLGHDD